MPRSDCEVNRGKASVNPCRFIFEVSQLYALKSSAGAFLEADKNAPAAVPQPWQNAQIGVVPLSVVLSRESFLPGPTTPA